MSTSDAAREAARHKSGPKGGQFGPRLTSEADMSALDLGPETGAVRGSIGAVNSLEPLPPRVEPRLATMSEPEIAQHYSRYLAKVAWLLADGERPIETTLTVEAHTVNPCLEFPGFADSDPFHISANTEVDDPNDPAYYEMNIVPHTAEEFPRLPHGFDEGDDEKAAEIVRAFIIRRMSGQKPSGLHTWA